MKVKVYNEKDEFIGLFDKENLVYTVKKFKGNLFKYIDEGKLKYLVRIDNGDVYEGKRKKS